MDTFHQKIPIGRPVLLATKALVAPSLGGKSPGMVLTHALCARPVVASDIAGYRDVMSAETSVSFRAGDEDALADAVESPIRDGRRREAIAAPTRRLVEERYSWSSIARRPVDVCAAAGAR